ncbi:MULTISPECIES: alpha/beta fold hydrolase [unclassified Microbacterium]|uniref:alpha/beta fold hydrolase n=1 Tax=unclassified Microbacterium TaxID=2609290 RepID=UPI003870CA20
MAHATGAPFAETPTRFIEVDGARIAYRELGRGSGIPLVALTHLGANLDDWDPRVADGLAAGRRVILLGYRGVGRSTGRVRSTIREMADDAVAAVRALGLATVDLFGLSMGGMVAQEIVRTSAHLVRRLVLVSAGPAGGPRLVGMTRVMVGGTARAILARRDPKADLFFTRSDVGRRAAAAYRARLRERSAEKDGPVGLTVLRAQLAAVHRWGLADAAPVSAFAGDVTVFHGDSDRMVPASNASALLRVFPAASVTVLPDAGQGVVFQNHPEIVAAVRAFLRR